MTRKRFKVENKKIGERIKHLRKTFDISYIVEGGDGIGLTQQELAGKLLVSEETVKSWEQCYSYPSADLLIRLANFFHCSVDYILGRTDRKSPKARLSDDAILMLDHLSDGMIQVISNLLSDDNFMYDLYIAASTIRFREGTTFDFSSYFTKDPVDIIIDGEEINTMIATRLYKSLMEFLQDERKRLESTYDPSNHTYSNYTYLKKL